MPTPTLIGPIPSDLSAPDRNYTFHASDVIQNKGYVEEEFFVVGTANSYTIVQSNASGSAPATIATSGNPYKTRIVVRRPDNPAKFNGVVLVEWQNATNQYDLDVLWQREHEQFIRSGYVWVGITAQSVTITSSAGLKQFSPTRYSTLDLTANGRFTSGDPLAYDVYSQALRAVRTTALVGPLVSSVKKVIAIGQSQSASKIGTWINAISTLEAVPVVDGALVESPNPNNERIRTSVSYPVFKVYTENEVASGVPAGAQPDSNSVRTWAIAGASHADAYQAASRWALARRDQPNSAQLGDNTCLQPSRSRVPERLVGFQAINWLVKWKTDGSLVPPIGQPLQYTAAGTDLARDADGNALGGIRLPTVVAPVALDMGRNTGPSLCSLNGVHIPFTDARLNALYPTRDAYFVAFRGAADQSVADGFLEQADADELVRDARVSLYGLGLNCDKLCADVAQFPIQPSTQLLRYHTKAFNPVGVDELVKPLDAATVNVALGQTSTDPKAQAAYFSLAAKWLQYYKTLVATALAQARISTVQAGIFNDYSDTLITELAKLGGNPDTVALDSNAVTALYRTLPAGDVTGDLRTDCRDIRAVSAAVGKRSGEFGFVSAADADNNGVIDVRDVAAVTRLLPAGTRCN